MKYSIGQFSELSGFSIDTLRYYEKQKYAKLRYAGDQTIPERLVLLFNQLDNLHEEEKKIEDNIEFVEQKIKTYLKTIGDLKE